MALYGHKSVTQIPSDISLYKCMLRGSLMLMKVEGNIDEINAHRSVQHLR